MKTKLLFLFKNLFAVFYLFSMNIGQKILRWYDINKRELPWRQTKDPYCVWVSEIIMQQTRIAQGLSYYLRFIEAFPNIHALASSSEEKVLHLWQGLGYYSRARNMHHTAKYIVEKYDGKFPTTFEDIKKLKGVGNYTASAIASFCFNEVKPAIDGNVYRVYARLFDIAEPIDKRPGQKLIEHISDQEIIKEHPGDYNQAMMDFGATICTPKTPACTSCVVQEHCMALKNNSIDKRPVKLGKQKIKKRYFNYIVISDTKNVLIQQRQKNDIWKNLYEFPLLETERVYNLEEIMTSDFVNALGIKNNSEIVHFIKQKPHKLSHQHIYAQFLMIHTSQLSPYENYKTIDINNLAN